MEDWIPNPHPTRHSLRRSADHAGLKDSAWLTQSPWSHRLCVCWIRPSTTEHCHSDSQAIQDLFWLVALQQLYIKLKLKKINYLKLRNYGRWCIQYIISHKKIKRNCIEKQLKKITGRHHLKFKIVLPTVIQEKQLDLQKTVGFESITNQSCVWLS